MGRVSLCYTPVTSEHLKDLRTKDDLAATSAQWRGREEDWAGVWDFSNKKFAKKKIGTNWDWDGKKRKDEQHDFDERVAVAMLLDFGNVLPRAKGSEASFPDGEDLETPLEPACKDMVWRIPGASEGTVPGL